MLHELHGNRSIGSGEDLKFEGVLPYMGVTDILVM